MKNIGKVMMTLAVVAMLVVATCACFVGCGQEETTTRLEAEYAKITDGRVDSKEDCVSNKFFVVGETEGGFGFEYTKPVVVQFDFNSTEECEAEIVICVMSANTFGNEFELSDADYLFYFNGEKLGVPASVVDYEGNPTTKVPKEDFRAGTGSVYMTYNVTLKEGANTFAWKYETGKGAFKFDYIDITGKTVITWEEDHTLVDAFEPMM